MGPVQQAIRARLSAPSAFRTFGQGKPFTLQTIDADGIVLLLGQGEWHTRLSWECLESVVPFLRSQAGWVPAGGKFSVAGEPGTLDQHLKRYLRRDVARWLARVLQEAGVAEVRPGPPLELKLATRIRA